MAGGTDDHDATGRARRTRRRKPAPDRRKQYRRADARSIQHLLSAFGSLHGHRGSERSKLAIALEATLLASPADDETVSACNVGTQTEAEDNLATNDTMHDKLVSIDDKLAAALIKVEQLTDELVAVTKRMNDAADSGSGQTADDDIALGSSAVINDGGMGSRKQAVGTGTNIPGADADGIASKAADVRDSHSNNIIEPPDAAQTAVFHTGDEDRGVGPNVANTSRRYWVGNTFYVGEKAVWSKGSKGTQKGKGRGSEPRC